MDEPLYPRTYRGARQNCGGHSFVISFPVPHTAIRAVGEMNHDLDAIEMPGPVGLRTNIADRLELQAGDRFYRMSGDTQNRVAPLDELATQRAADETGRAGYQNPCQASPFGAMMRIGCVRDVTVSALNSVAPI
jgi:hypothetical protein